MHCCETLATGDIYTNYRIVGKFGELTLFEPLAKEIWRINRSANRIFIVSTNLDGFSLANHRRFAKFAKLSPAKLSCYMVHALQ